jgi:AcrR family transcriptional regulator
MLITERTPPRGYVVTAAKVVDPDEGPRSKRAAILSIAIRYFGKEGYDATKWSKVAEKVGIGQTALYHYFESKAHCLLTIMRMELERSYEMFVKATAGETDPMAALRAAVRGAYDVSEHDVLRMRILENNSDLLAVKRQSAREEDERAAARQLVHQIETAWTELLERGMDEGVFVRRDARTLALSLLGMIVSVWRWYRPRGTMPLAEIRDMIEDACVRVVTP